MTDGVKDYNKIDYSKDDIEVMKAKLKAQRYNLINDDDSLTVKEAKLKAYQTNKNQQWSAEIEFKYVDKPNKTTILFCDDLIELLYIIEYIITEEKEKELASKVVDMKIHKQNTDEN